MNLPQVIETRLDQMLYGGRGPMWGGTEAYELQVLLLLELLYFAGEPHSFMPRYTRFLALRHPALGVQPMSALYDHDVIAMELSAFRAQLARAAASDPAQLGQQLPADPPASGCDE